MAKSWRHVNWRRMGMRIVPGDLSDPRIIALVRTHVETAHAATARGSAHALDISGLQTPELRFWALWEGEDLRAIGALKFLSPRHGEVKSMHTARDARRGGAGSAMLRHIVEAARAAGLSRVSLETGSWPYFEPARAFYRRHGFVECPAFEGYQPDPNSVFMTMML